MGLAIVASASGCLALVDPNPSFDAGLDDSGADDSGETGKSSETGKGSETGDAGETGDAVPTACAEGSLDCDEIAGCEASAEAPETCGSCDHSCIVDGVTHSCGAGVCTASFELPALSDVIADEAMPELNYEGDDVLWVRANPSCDAFIELPALPEIPGASVDAAWLALIATDGGANVEVRRLLDPWDASELTWSSPPALDEVAVASFSPGLGGVGVRVEALAEIWLSGAPNYGLALTTEINNQAAFASIETGEGPVLHLELSW